MSRPASRSLRSSSTSFESRSATIARYSASACAVIFSLRKESASASRASTNRRPSAALDPADVATAEAASTAGSGASVFRLPPRLAGTPVDTSSAPNALRSCSTTPSFNLSSSLSSTTSLFALFSFCSAFSALACASEAATAGDPLHCGLVEPLSSGPPPPSAIIATVSARAVCARDCASRRDARNASRSASASRRSEAAFAAKASLSRAAAAAISARAPSRAAFAAAAAASRAPASSAHSSSSSETRALRRSVSSRAVCASRESRAASSEPASFSASPALSAKARVTSASLCSATSSDPRSSTACTAAASARRRFAASEANKLRSVSFAAQSSRVTPTSRTFSEASFVLFSSPRIIRPTTSDSKYALRSRTASPPLGEPSNSSAAARAACFAAAASASATRALRAKVSARRVASLAARRSFVASAFLSVSCRVADANASSSFSTRAYACLALSSAHRAPTASRRAACSSAAVAAAVASSQAAVLASSAASAAAARLCAALSPAAAVLAAEVARPMSRSASSTSCRKRCSTASAHALEI